MLQRAALTDLWWRDLHAVRERFQKSNEQS
jgi:hypothetical protein